MEEEGGQVGKLGDMASLGIIEILPEPNNGSICMHFLPVLHCSLTELIFLLVSLKWSKNNSKIGNTGCGCSTVLCAVYLNVKLNTNWAGWHKVCSGGSWEI